MGLGGGGGAGGGNANEAPSTVVDYVRSRERTPPIMDSPRKGKAVYEGLGIGWAATPAASTGPSSRAGRERIRALDGTLHPKEKEGSSGLWVLRGI